MYWETKLKKIVAERWEEHKSNAMEDDASASTKPTDGVPIAFINKVVRECFEAEPKDVVDTVMKFRKTSGSTSDDDEQDMDMGTEVSKEATKAQQYHR